MTVRQFDELHKLEYKPVVDRLIETIERTLPDSIDDCGIGCIVDFNWNTGAEKIRICVDDFRMRNKSNDSGVIRVNNKINLTK